MPRISLILICLLTVSCATNIKQESYDDRYNQNIVGTWTCELTRSESGVVLTIKKILDYYPNNTYTVFTYRQDELVNDNRVLRVFTSSYGSWSIDNGYKLETIDDLKLLHYTTPSFKDLFNIQSLTPSDNVTSSRIIEMTEAYARFELQEGVTYDCHKVSVK